MKNKGIFITLEGGEGSGKTTAIKNIEKFFKSQGKKVLITREPGGISVSEKIREVILYEKMSSMTEALLFAAARKEHLDEKVIPALNSGAVVICDRFVHSSYVYQGLVGELGLETVKNLNQMVIGDYTPDLTLFIDVEPEVGLARIKSNNRQTNKIDEYDISFHKKVQNGYYQLMSEDKRMIRINGNRTVSEVSDAINSVLCEQIEGIKGA